ncbi:MAG: TIGR02466 family protein [Halioglobus sp.]
MFTKGEIKQLFPSCVWVHELQNFREINVPVADELAELRKSTGYENPNNGAWQSRGNLNKLEAFEPLMDCFKEGSKRVLDFLKLEYDDFVITDSWANVNPPGHSHMSHTHPNNFLSGVYYVKAPEGSGDIEFLDPRQQALVLQPRVKAQTLQNAWKQRVTPMDGQLLIFNSWFQHQVKENLSQEDRISISFNIMLKGSVGVESAGAVF